ncbi:D-2-hydroxyacid dehydrogenase [Gammaproteobacteria bacterium]|jgi:phosphoglycerate dehydrogenase-like enzyme|nr:D-2-hydroxyacid dehydrogenase [Gammaproteobacteria bacterium]
MHPFIVRAACAAASLIASTIVVAETEIEKLIEQTGMEPGAVAVRDLPGWHMPQKIVIREIGGVAAEFESLVPGAQFVFVGSQREALGHVKDADVIIGYCSQELVAAAAELVWIQILSAGADRCIAAERVGSGEILLTNARKLASPIIGEHVIALALSLARGLVPYGKSMPSGQWLDDSTISDGMQSIAGKTMLVSGLGGIGTEAARRAAALDMRVIATRRSSREGPDFVDYVGLSDELHDLAGQADFIVNALPLTPETEGLYDAKFFAAAKRGAYFISIGRGKSVVTDDLVAALESGQIAGAGLDVTDPEPLPEDHPLWQMHNVIITPHVASNGGNRARHITLIKENLRRFAAGDALLNVVDPALGY